MNTAATEFESITLEECADRLLAIENPLVLMHARPDGDAVGSGAALCRIFEALGKHPRIACPDPIPKRLAFLAEGLELAIDPVSREPLCDLSTLTAVSIDVPSAPQLGFVGELVSVDLAIDHHQVNRPYSTNYTVGGASSAGEVLLGVARIAYAKILLSTGELSINEISERCGYSYAEHFVRQFKSRTGVSPGKFRMGK